MQGADGMPGKPNVATPTGACDISHNKNPFSTWQQATRIMWPRTWSIHMQHPAPEHLAGGSLLPHCSARVGTSRCPLKMDTTMHRAQIRTM